MIKGADFSEDGLYRYSLWRIWDESKPIIMFVGLNPSTANEETNDATIRRVISMAKRWNFGGVYMMNCFPFISTNPYELIHSGSNDVNDQWLRDISLKCQDIIFAWGAFDIVKETGRDQELTQMFPGAMALVINKDGSPRHPLYVPSSVKPIKWQ